MKNSFLIQGYASVFNIQDCTGEIIAPSAFAPLQPRSVKLLWQHNHEHPIGVVEELRQDNHGLFVRARINCEVEKGREAASLVKQGAIKGLSVGFNAIKHHYDAHGKRVITKAKLWEISVVTFPANPSAQILDDTLTTKLSNLYWQIKKIRQL